jgi:hypothetical protein
MGSDAAAYIFDDRAYRERVAPALRHFVHTGAAEGWLDVLLRRLDPDVWEFNFPLIRGLGFSFDVVCNYLGPDFGFGGSEGNQWSAVWEHRGCRSQTCPAKKACPLHQAHQAAAADFNALLELCVVDQCLGPGQFLGRSVSPMWYTEILAEAGIGLEHPLFDYLRKLEYRGFVVGYQFANSDGTHGWLTAEETKPFHERLQGLDLPQFEPSFHAMEAFRPPGYQYEAPPPYSFRQLSLAFLRTVAGLAVSEGKGILWGNDVSTWWTEQPRPLDGDGKPR